jgi:hypothetical protein
MHRQVEHPRHRPDQDTERGGCVEAPVVLEMSADRERHGYTYFVLACVASLITLSRHTSPPIAAIGEFASA